MRAKSLRDLQTKGEKAVAGSEPVLLTNRKGPVGILVPVTAQSLPYVQAEVEKITALQSLRATWRRAAETGLDRLSDAEIEREVHAARRALRTKRGTQGRKG